MSVIITGPLRFTGASIVSIHPAEVIIDPVSQDRLLLDEDGTPVLLEDGENVQLEDKT